MPHRDSKEEKLVEEIGWQFCIICKYMDIELGRCAEEHWKDRICDVLRHTTEDAITRIGKAYADGELELPGEVGRFPASRQIPGWTRGWILQMLSKGAKNFIALRPLSGTGKEEE